MLTRIRQGLTENRLLVLTIGGFLGLYCVSAYLLVSRGVQFIAKLPMIGPLLTERMIYLLFMFFFIMLILSNATITGMSLFRRKEMEWQIALPIPWRSLVLWKTIEGMLLASWGLVILSAPILLAFGQIFHAGVGFYANSLLALLCLVTIAANVSTCLLLLIVRFAQRWWWRIIGITAAIFVILALVKFGMSKPVPDPTDTALTSNLHDVLKHTELSMHPLLPSAWVAEVIFGSGRGIPQRAWFYTLLLLSHALVAFVVTSGLTKVWFYSAWNRMMTASPHSQHGRSRKHWFQAGATAKKQSFFWHRFLGLDRASQAVLLKEVRTFLREPTQWGQTALIFGLLFMYMANLRQLGYDLENPFWITVISHLNLVVCSLSLSTLTTRFLFPQFSQEGQRLWILGLSPLPLHRVLALKLRLSASILSLLTAFLVLISSISLDLPWQKTLFFCAAIILLSYGLTALALALGALLPNFREPNPARIVSGFGGTLCLITSFLYILLSMAALAIPAWLALRPSPEGQNSSLLAWNLAGLGAVAVLTLIFGGIPYWLAKKRTKFLEYLAHM